MEVGTVEFLMAKHSWIPLPCIVFEVPVARRLLLWVMSQKVIADPILKPVKLTGMWLSTTGLTQP